MPSKTRNLDQLESLKNNPQAVRSFLQQRLEESDEHTGYYNCPFCSKHKLWIGDTSWQCHTGGCHENRKGDLIGLLMECDWLEEAANGLKPETPAKTASRKPASFPTVEEAVSWFKGKFQSVIPHRYGPDHYVLRLEAEGEKEFRPLTLQSGRWVLTAGKDKWPVYVPSEATAKVVIIVEGEKCADALNACQSGEFIAVTSRGGANNARGTDWKTLPQADEYLIWPDADSNGQKYAQEVKRLLPKAKILDVSAFPEKHDAADFLGVCYNDEGRISLKESQNRSIDKVIEFIRNSQESTEKKDPERPIKPLSLADASSLIQGLKWIWKDWILAGQLTLVTGATGAGKSTLMADLARRVYRGENWPDGQAQTIEPGRSILWLNSDRRMDQLHELWKSNQIPPEKCYLAHETGNVLNPLHLDDPASIQLIREYVKAVNPWALVIDTIARATSLDLCQPQAVTEITRPLLELSEQTGIAIFLLGHTNNAGQAYGRHLKTTCQVCWRLEGTSATSTRTLLNDERCVSKSPEPIGATIQVDGSWKWGEVVNPDESGRLQGCARLIMEQVSRNGRKSWNELKELCELGGGYTKGTVHKAATRLVELDLLIAIKELSNSGKPFTVYEIATPPAANPEQEQEKK
jgi:hypothetical protein